MDPAKPFDKTKTTPHKPQNVSKMVSFLIQYVGSESRVQNVKITDSIMYGNRKTERLINHS